MQKLTYSRYYRYCLNESRKQLYDALLRGIERFETEIHTPHYEEEDIDLVYYGLNYDNPGLYYVNFSNVSYSVCASFCIFHIKYYMNEAEYLRAKRSIENAVLPLLTRIRGAPQKESALAIHDWLVTRCEYGEYEDRPYAAHSIIGPFIDKKCVCEGYAKAYKYLADEARLRCTVVTGKGVHPDGSGGPHGWNIIRIGRKFYHVDATYDTLFAGKYCSRAYFMLSDHEILHDHVPDTSFQYPACPEDGKVLEVVGGTAALISFLELESRKGVTHSEVRLTKGFTVNKLREMVEKRVELRDSFWINRLKNYWYGDYSRTLFVRWK